MPEIRFDDDYHKRLREKVRRHRAKHKAELQLRADTKALAAGRMKMGPAERWTLWERIQPFGHASDVLMIRDGEPVPSGYWHSYWLPRSPVSCALALVLRRERLRQIRVILKN
jgi:hypothetical protein